MTSAAFEYVGGPGLSTKDALLVGALITRIQRENARLSTEELLREMIARSRPAESDTHHLFEWDPVKGHALYLMHRARTLVMSVRVVNEEKPEMRVRAFPVVIAEGKRGPMAIKRVLDSRDLTVALLEQAFADLEVWKKRYEQLRELAELRPVFEAEPKDAAQ